MGNYYLTFQLEGIPGTPFLKMTKILNLFGLCLVLASVVESHYSKKKDSKSKFYKGKELKCTTVLDEVTHEVCRTEYHDECTDKTVDDCKTIWNKVCTPATEKKCRFVSVDKCILIPVPYCHIKFEERCRTDCVHKTERVCHTPQDCQTVTEDKCHQTTETVCQEVEEQECKLISQKKCSEPKVEAPQKWKRSVQSVAHALVTLKAKLSGKKVAKVAVKAAVKAEKAKSECHQEESEVCAPVWKNV